jgi:hypothetical protein
MALRALHGLPGSQPLFMALLGLSWPRRIWAVLLMWQLILLTKLDPQLTHAIRIAGTETTQTVSPFASTLSPNTIMASASARSMLLAKNDNDVVIVAAVRSALTKVWMKSLSHRPERRSLTQISGQERWF